MIGFFKIVLVTAAGPAARMDEQETPQTKGTLQKITRISPRKSHQLRPHLAVAARNQADTAAPPHGQGQHGIGQQAASMKTQRQVEFLERAEGNKNLRGQFGLAWRVNCEKIHWHPKRSTKKTFLEKAVISCGAPSEPWSHDRTESLKQQY